MHPGGLHYQEMSMLKSMLVNNDIQTWHLIGWQHSCQPIRSHVRKSLLWNLTWILLSNPGPCAPVTGGNFYCIPKATENPLHCPKTTGLSLLCRETVKQSTQDTTLAAIDMSHQDCSCRLVSKHNSDFYTNLWSQWNKYRYYIMIVYVRYE